MVGSGVSVGETFTYEDQGVESSMVLRNVVIGVVDSARRRKGVDVGRGAFCKDFSDDFTANLDGIRYGYPCAKEKVRHVFVARVKNPVRFHMHYTRPDRVDLGVFARSANTKSSFSLLDQKVRKVFEGALEILLGHGTIEGFAVVHGLVRNFVPDCVTPTDNIAHKGLLGIAFAIT